MNRDAKRDAESIDYALKLLSLARTSAQISGTVRPAEWAVACIFEAVDNTYLSRNEGVSCEESAKLLQKLINERFRLLKKAAKEREEKQGSVGWMISDIVKRAVGK